MKQKFKARGLLILSILQTAYVSEGNNAQSEENGQAQLTTRKKSKEQFSSSLFCDESNNYL